MGPSCFFSLSLLLPCCPSSRFQVLDRDNIIIVPKPSLPPSSLVPLRVSHRHRVQLGDQSSAPKAARFDLELSNKLGESAGLEVSEARRAELSIATDFLLTREHHQRAPYDNIYHVSISPDSDLETWNPKMWHREAHGSFVLACWPHVCLFSLRSLAWKLLKYML